MWNVTSHNVKSKCFSPIAQTDTSGYLAICQHISNTNRDACSVAPHQQLNSMSGPILILQMMSYK